MAEAGAALEPWRREVNHDSLSWDCIVVRQGGGMSAQASRHMILGFLGQSFPISTLLQSADFRPPSDSFGFLDKETGACQLTIPGPRAS